MGFYWLTTRFANLAYTQSATRKHPQPQNLDQTEDDLSGIYNGLYQWLNLALERLHLPSKEPSDKLLDGDALFELIRTSSFSLVSGAGSFPPKLQDCTISLCLMWLFHNRKDAPKDYTKHVESSLASFTPRPTTFHGFVKHLFGNNPVGDARHTVQSYIYLLQSCDIRKLEASLCGSALYVVENLESDTRLTPNDRTEVKLYRQQLVELVDEAESKLFKAPTQVAPVAGTWGSRGEGFSAISHSPWSKGGWEWEPVIGCWVRKQAVDLASPSAAIARKRRRIAFATPMKSNRPLSWDSPADGLPGLWARTPRPKLHLHRNTPRTGKIPALFPTKTVQFTSLVANAVSRRTVLHPVNQNQSRRSSIDEVILPSDDLNLASSPVVDHYHKESKERNRTFYEASHHQPSDDVLDFLASSP